MDTAKRGGPGERELMDLSPAEGTNTARFLLGRVLRTPPAVRCLRLVHADGSPRGGRHALILALGSEALWL